IPLDRALIWSYYESRGETAAAQAVSVASVRWRMALLSRKVDYALLILSYLRHRPEGGCARAIADRFGLSRAFVANILKALCQQGFVVSHRGVKGGYVLR